MIQKPSELQFNDQKFSMLIYGAPGVGKTTLAASAPRPLLVDIDRGVNLNDVVVPDAKDQVRASRLKILREVPAA